MPANEQTGRAISIVGWLQWLLIGSAALAAAVLAQRVYPDNPAASEIMSALAAFWLALPLFRLAWLDLWRGQLTMNMLVLLALLAAFLAQAYYTAGGVAALMLFSMIIEQRTAAGASSAIEALVRMMPQEARRVIAGGAEEIVRVAELAVGDVIRVRPGEMLPADGVICAGQTALDEASVTGESLPADKSVGAQVFAGTHNLTGMIEVEVNCIGRETTLGRVRELIAAAERSRLPATRVLDVFIRYYLPVVVMVAALLWIVARDLARVIALLVIACPCALVIAAPAALVAALAAAARQGVLLKKAGDLEMLAGINAFVFDKTGTLTEGVPQVVRLAPLEGVTPAELLLTAAAAERHSNHPLAQALRRLCNDRKIAVPQAEECRETPGCGVQAVVDGAEVMVGQAVWLAKSAAVEIPPLPEDAGKQGWSILWVVKNRRCLGWIAFGDTVRPNAANCLQRLSALGVERIALVTGDRPAAAAAIAAAVNCREVRDRCLPETKVEFVQGLRREGWRVAVVGDGINDAPALAAGDVGIAMGAAGSAIAVHSADIALMNNNLDRLPFLLELARKMRRIVLQNIFIGGVFIVGGMIFAGSGWLHPLAAALLHNGGSLLVIFNSARLATAVGGVADTADIV